MRRAGHGDAAVQSRIHGLAVGTERRLHLLGIGAGIGRFEIDDVAEENFSFVQFVAPDDDRLEGQRAFAQAGDHRFAAGLDALGDGDFALARQQFDRTHFAQIHAHRIVGTLGRLFFLDGGQRLRFRLDDLAAGVVIVVVVLLVGGLLGLAVVAVGVLGLDHVDAHFGQHGERIFDLLGVDLLRRHHGIELLIGDIAALLGGLDHLLDGGIGQVEQRQRRIRRAFGFLLGSLFALGKFLRMGGLRLRRHLLLLDLPSHVALFLALPRSAVPRPIRRAHAQKGPRR